jgi:hypothetical protein
MKSELNIKSLTSTSIPLTDQIDHPNISNLIYSISKLISNSINDDIYLDKDVLPTSDLYMFTEDKYLYEHPHSIDFDKLFRFHNSFTHEDIMFFFKGLYLAIDFSPECFIISLVYLNRFVAITNSPLLPNNWRPLILISLILANKVWDDSNKTYIDVSIFYPFFTRSQFEHLERRFLEMINYNVKVSLSCYSSYFMELKSLNPSLKSKDLLNYTKIKEIQEKQQRFVYTLRKKSRTYI